MYPLITRQLAGEYTRDLIARHPDVPGEYWKRGLAGAVASAVGEAIEGAYALDDPVIVAF
jgi:hypothetical protein